MVNPTSLSASLSAIPSTLQQSSGINHSSVTEEGCNDDPPPILSPPVGNSAGGVPSNQPDTHSGPSSKLSSDVTTQSSTEDHQITKALDGHQGSRIYDYGFSGKPFHSTAASSPMYEGTPSGQSSTTAVDTVTVNSTVDSFDAVAPHAATPEAVSSLFRVDLKAGLTSQEAEERLVRDGPNKLTSGKGVTWWSVLLRQVSNSLTLVRKIRLPRLNLLFGFLLRVSLHHLVFTSSPGEDTNPSLPFLPFTSEQPFNVVSKMNAVGSLVRKMKGARCFCTPCSSRRGLPPRWHFKTTLLSLLPMGSGEPLVAWTSVSFFLSFHLASLRRGPKIQTLLVFLIADLRTELELIVEGVFARFGFISGWH